MNHIAHAKNGSGSRAVLIVFYERRSQFTKSGITFERIQFELIWSLTGNSGLIKKDLATTSRLSIGVSKKRPTNLQQFCDLHGVQGRAFQQLIA